jgi:mitochondrial fission protein ELM1
MSKALMTQLQNGAGHPRIWALTEGRAGDNAQVIALARALDLPYRVLTLEGNTIPRMVLDRIVDLLGLGRKPLRLPDDAPDVWPDLVIAIAGGSVSTVRRIVAASGGATRSVLLGRPVSSLRTFDLVVTTAQYGLPEAPNVLNAALPFGTTAKDSEGTAMWAEKLSKLPRPFTALLIGGNSGSYELDSASLARIVETATQAVSGGGSILATTSPRTPAFVADTLRKALPSPNHLHAFTPHDKSGDPNPYAAFLDLADRIIVTGESASMIADAVKTGRNIEVVPLKPKLLSRLLVGLHRAAIGVAGGLIRSLTLRGLWVPPRDLEAFRKGLFEAEFTRGNPALRPPDDQQVLARVRALIEPPAAPGSESGGETEAKSEAWPQPTTGSSE